MEYKFITEEQELKNRMYEGVHKVASIVGKTLGPKGKSIAISNTLGEPTITNDGVTVAKNIKLIDPFENMGAQLIIQVANNADKVGDGTTTATLLADSILTNFKKSYDDETIKHCNLNRVKDGMFYALSIVKESLINQKKDIENEQDLINIAITSCKDEKLGTIIGKAAYQIGKGAVLNVEKGYSKETTSEIVNGIKIKSGYMSHYFCGSDGKCTLNNPLVFLYNDEFNCEADILPLIGSAFTNKRDLFIICKDISPDCLSLLIANKTQSGLNYCVIKNPYTGNEAKELFEDLSTMFGVKVVGEDESITTLPVGRTQIERYEIETVKDDSLFGTCKKIIVEKDSTSIIDIKINSILVNEKIRSLREEMDNLSDADKEYTKQRISFLLGKCATIKVGGYSSTEVDSKMFKVQDAVHSVMEALDNGILPGEGKALYNCEVNNLTFIEEFKDDKDFSKGYDIVFNSLKIPFLKLVNNSGLFTDSEIDTSKLDTAPNIGITLNNGMYVDLFKAGIVDSYNTVLSSISNAISVISTLISVDGSIVNINEVLEEDLSKEIK